VLENISSNTPAERPKTLKKLKRVYENTTSEAPKSDNEKSSSSEKESENKENKERVSALSPFDEQEEWAKIQEIMASFGTGIVRESVFVAELGERVPEPVDDAELLAEQSQRRLGGEVAADARNGGLRRSVHVERLRRRQLSGK
jgi:hypothetical protein